MSSYIILTMPTTIGPASMSWGIQRFDSQFVSPLGGDTQTIRRGARWTCSLTWPTLQQSEYQPLSAFFAQLADRQNAVLLTNPAYQPRGGIGGDAVEYLRPSPEARSTAYALGNLVLGPNGFAQECTTAGTTGSSEPDWDQTVGGYTTDGTVVWNNLGGPITDSVITLNFVGGTNPALMAGDFLQFATTNQLVQVTDAVVAASPYFHLVAHVTPALRTSPDGSNVIYTAPAVTMQLTSGASTYTVQAPRSGALSADFIEVISP